MHIATDIRTPQSIYGDDVVDLRPATVTGPWKPLNFTIALGPLKGSTGGGGGDEVYVKTKLHIICPTKYPKV